jgi:hypothetical protein
MHKPQKVSKNGITPPRQNNIQVVFQKISQTRTPTIGFWTRVCPPKSTTMIMRLFVGVQPSTWIRHKWMTISNPGQFKIRPNLHMSKRWDNTRPTIRRNCRLRNSWSTKDIKCTIKKTTEFLRVLH